MPAPPTAFMQRSIAQVAGLLDALGHQPQRVAVAARRKLQLGERQRRHGGDAQQTIRRTAIGYFLEHRSAGGHALAAGSREVQRQLRLDIAALGVERFAVETVCIVYSVKCSLGVRHETVEITAKELRSKVGAALACADRGETVTITYRGKPRAQLVGVDQGQGQPMAKEEERMPAFGMWQDRDDIADVAAHVRDLRKGRVLAG